MDKLGITEKGHLPFFPKLKLHTNNPMAMTNIHWNFSLPWGSLFSRIKDAQQPIVCKLVCKTEIDSDLENKLMVGYQEKVWKKQSMSLGLIDKCDGHRISIKRLCSTRQQRYLCSTFCNNHNEYIGKIAKKIIYMQASQVMLALKNLTVQEM